MIDEERRVEMIKGNMILGRDPEFGLDPIAPFEKQVEDVMQAVGFTLTPSAWEQIKDKFKDKIKNIERFRICGIPCYIVNNQTEDCVAWYLQAALDLYLTEMSVLEKETENEIKSK